MRFKPADHGLLEDKFRALPFDLEVDEILEMAQARIPVFGDVNALLFRELMLDSNVMAPAEGDIIFSKNDYTNTFFTVLQGEVNIEINEDLSINSGMGSFFGEMSLISGPPSLGYHQGGKELCSG